MTNITPQNCDAVYVFSTFLVAYAWASSDGTGNLFFADPEGRESESTAEWVRLLRGCRTLIRRCYDWVMVGHRETFLEVYNGQPMVSELEAEDAAKFAALETLCKFIRSLLLILFLMRHVGTLSSAPSSLATVEF